MGLGLLAGKSPYALQNVGEAGLGALKQEQEAKLQGLKERQVAAEELKAQTEANTSKVYAERYGVSPQIQLINAMKDPEFAARYKSFVETQREPMTEEKLLTAYISSPQGQIKGMAGWPDFLNSYRQSQMPADTMGGFKYMGSRPSQ